MEIIGTNIIPTMGNPVLRKVNIANWICMRKLFPLCFLLTTASAWAYSDFHLEIAPFLWNINMNGRAQVSFKTAHIDVSRPGGFLAAQISKNNLSLFTHIIYSRISENYHSSFYTANVINKFGILTGAIAYNLYQRQLFQTNPMNRIEFEPYAGVRYTLKSTTASISSRWLNTKIEHNQNWADPIIGLNLYYVLNPVWRLLLSGDIGGTNSSTDYSYQTAVIIGYRLPKTFCNFNFYLGYKILDQHYINGHEDNYFNWNVKISGPLAGIGIALY